MKKTGVTEKFTCEFCNSSFAREKTLVSHICERKHRWLDKSSKSSRLGFQSWLQFYAKHSVSTKPRTFEDFIRSPYYLAFKKFGTYCAEANVLNIPRYIDWLLKEQIGIDTWNKDSTYNKFLIEYLRSEDPYDAIARSISSTMELSADAGVQTNDCLRYCNPNKICYAVTMGKISPWMLFQSDSGTEFLSTLNQDCVKIVIDYINPEQWALKFNRDPEMVKSIKGLLKQAGY